MWYLTMKNKRKYIVVVVLFFLFVGLIVFSILQNNNNSSEHRLQWWLSAINWESDKRIYSGQNIKIAIIDSKIDASHSDLGTNITTIPILSEDKHSNNYHGTGIAGIICGFPSNENGVLGIAPDVEIVSFPVVDENGEIDIDDIVLAIKKSIDMDVDIINISCGLSQSNKNLEKIIGKAV